MDSTYSPISSAPLRHYSAKTVDDHFIYFVRISVYRHATVQLKTKAILANFYTGLFKMIVGV